MSSQRVYQFLRLAYSGTRQYLSSAFNKQNVVTDKDYAPPLINHPTCIDNASTASQLSLSSYSMNNNYFKVICMLSKPVNANVSINGQIDVLFQGTTYPVYFSNVVIAAGGTVGVGLTTFLPPGVNGFAVKSGIVSYFPTAVGAVNILNNTPYN